MTGLPLGDASLHSDAVMVNILGDSWYDAKENVLEPLWNKALAHKSLKLHLYGKQEPRKARKMGHFTVIDKTLESALNVALIARSELNIGWTQYWLIAYGLIQPIKKPSIARLFYT